jgi:hypothetical protein
MHVDDWLKAVEADAARRGLEELRPLLETLAQATRALRTADWNDDPSGAPNPSGGRGPVRTDSA